MYARTITPTIEVTIGRETRLYHAFVTTAPASSDAPGTVTLSIAPLADLVGMTDPTASHTARSKVTARLVLVDATELAWQRARYREGHHVFAIADPVLVGLPTLQHWLWRRISTRAPEPGLATA